MDCITMTTTHANINSAAYRLDTTPTTPATDTGIAAIEPSALARMFAADPMSAWVALADMTDAQLVIEAIDYASWLERETGEIANWALILSMFERRVAWIRMHPAANADADRLSASDRTVAVLERMVEENSHSAQQARAAIVRMPATFSARPTPMCERWSGGARGCDPLAYRRVTACCLAAPSNIYPRAA